MPKTGFHYFLIGLLVVSLLAAGIYGLLYVQSPRSMKVIQPVDLLVIDLEVVNAVTEPLILSVDSVASLEVARIDTFLNGDPVQGVVFSYMGKGNFQAGGLPVSAFPEGQSDLIFRITLENGNSRSAKVVIERRRLNLLEQAVGGALFSEMYFAIAVLVFGLGASLATKKMPFLYVSAVLSGLFYLAIYRWFGWVAVILAVGAV